jgi:hypothetical protein
VHITRFFELAVGATALFWPMKRAQNRFFSKSISAANVARASASSMTPGVFGDGSLEKSVNKKMKKL